VLTLFALVGLGTGALLRNQIVAVTVGVIFILVIARLFLLIPGVKYVYPYLPTGAVDSIITDPHDTEARVINGVHLISPGAGIAVLVVWGLVLSVLGAGITMNRDIS
jgi:ABC-type transport system involved in multi-copper enzyme maturation permease subunit